MITKEQLEKDRAELLAQIPPELWATIPNYMRGGIERWILYGLEPGDFLRAVLCNDLRSSCALADDTNRHLLFEYVAFLYSHAPIGSWGGDAEYLAWQAAGGLKHYKREPA